ncbi:MAG: glycosyltransferase [Anaerolineales bacterium]
MIDSLSLGGAQKLLVLFAEEAKVRSLKVTVISLTTKDSNDAIAAELESLGVRIVFLTIHKLYDPTALSRLLMVLRNEKIDVIQTHLRNSNILGVLAGRLLNIPVIATLHSTHARPIGRFFRLRIITEQLLLRFGARCVIAVGQRIGDMYRDRLIDKKVDIVPNPVKFSSELSQEQRSTLRHEIAGDSQRFLILTVGRLKPEKGLHDLLSAFAQVSERHPSAILVVVGDGEMLGKLKSQAASLGMVDDVRFTGSRNDVPGLMSASDIYVSSSYREGLSLSMLEAMAAGLPIVATKVGDTEFLLKDGRGLMVAPHDTPALVDGMCCLIENPVRMKEIGCAARKYVEANYSPSQWMEKLLGVYEQARNYAS